MDIIVNGVPAVIKQGSVIEYVSENPDFKDVADFTLSISFPIKGCEANKRIFGYLGLPGEDWPQRVFSATLQAGKFIRQGCLSVVEGSDLELKCQFLAGRSESNYKLKIDECFIDELDLGSWMSRGRNGVDLSALDGVEAVPLPWVIDNTGNIQNVTLSNEPGGVVSPGGMSGRHPDVVVALSQGRSYMPYMLYLAKKIAAAIGMTADFDQWEMSDKKYLLCCNVLPSAWNISEYARALPHWSVQEFFSQLGYVLGGDFDFDFSTNKLSFRERSAFFVVKIDKLLDEFSVEMSDSEVEYVGADMVGYADRGDEQWKYLSCQWIVDRSNVKRYPTFAALKGYCHENFYSYNNDGRPASWGLPNGVGSIYYAADIDTHFVIEIVSKSKVSDFDYNFITRLRPINVFAQRNYCQDEDTHSREIKILPVRIDDADEYGSTVFLAPKAFDENYRDEDSEFVQTPTLREIKRGRDEGKASYYDHILAGYWKDGDSVSVESRHHPIVDYVEIVSGWDLELKDLGMRLRGCEDAKFGCRIDSKRKFSFSFLADDLPDVKSIFYIEGHFYVCAKITATINSYGLSQKFKGEFYRVQSVPS